MLHPLRLTVLTVLTTLIAVLAAASCQLVPDIYRSQPGLSRENSIASVETMEGVKKYSGKLVTLIGIYEESGDANDRKRVVVLKDGTRVTLKSNQSITIASGARVRVQGYIYESPAFIAVKGDQVPPDPKAFPQIDSIRSPERY